PSSSSTWRPGAGAWTPPRSAHSPAPAEIPGASDLSARHTSPRAGGRSAAACACAAPWRRVYHGGRGAGRPQIPALDEDRPVTYSVADYERDAERFCQAAGARRHRYVSGRAPSLDLSSLFEDWGHLFGLDLIEQLGQEAIEPNRRRALVAFAVQGRLARATRRQTTRLTEVEAAATVVWEQQALPLGSVAPRLANMADVPARHRLDAARRACIEQERGARVSRLEAWRDAHEDLLERDPVAHADRLLGLGLEALQAQAAQLLEATDGVYRDALAAAGRLAGLERGDIWSADLDWLTRAP